MRASGYRKTVPVIVRVTDINDNSPEFVRLPYSTRIPEVGEALTPRYMSREMPKFTTDKFDTRNKRKF